MRHAPFKVILHAGSVDGMAFQPHRDVVELYGTISVGKLRDLYRDKLVRDGVSADEAIRRSEAVRGGLVFTAESFEGLGFDSPPANDAENRERLLLAASESRNHSGVSLRDQAPARRIVAKDAPEVRKAARSSRPVLDVNAVSAAVERSRRELLDN